MCRVAHLGSIQFVGNDRLPMIPGETRAILARPGRFERPTYRLGGGCSILLSYGRVSGEPGLLPVAPMKASRKRGLAARAAAIWSQWR